MRYILYTVSVLRLYVLVLYYFIGLTCKYYIYTMVVIAALYYRINPLPFLKFIYSTICLSLKHVFKNYFCTKKLKLKLNLFFKDKLSLTDTTVKFLLKETVD